MSRSSSTSAPISHRPFITRSNSNIWLLLLIVTIAMLPNAVNALAGPCFVGFDLGTSGARISIVQQDDTASSTSLHEVFSDSIPWTAYDDATAWETVVYSLLDSAKTSMSKDSIMQQVKSICVSGTSASCLLVDQHGNMSRAAPRMYDYDVTSPKDSTFGTQALELLDKHAPPNHTARAKTSSLAKLVTWILERPLLEDGAGEFLCHQSDYIAMKLAGGDGSKVCSDHHNVLKCGYDVRKLEWPSWVKACLEEAAGSNSAAIKNVLPETVVSPGQPFGTLNPDLAKRFGLADGVALVGGTTDSNAAFFAATAGGAGLTLGTAVTSLGSTLAMKQLSSTYVEDASRGVYSHRFPNYFTSDSDDENAETWLIGGASNVGCAVLRQEGFSDDELIALSKEIDPSADIDLSYYPLQAKGERFPIADSDKEAILTPVPESRRDYLHGILQGISDVERTGFVVLGELGATPAFPKTVMTCGGGSKNDMWISMRQRKLNEKFCADGADGISVQRAENTEASYGAAVLAAATFI